MADEPNSPIRALAAIEQALDDCEAVFDDLSSGVPSLQLHAARRMVRIARETADATGDSRGLLKRVVDLLESRLPPDSPGSQLDFFRVASGRQEGSE